MNKNKHKGFTLIEVLIAISMVAILSAAVIAGLGNARVGARRDKAFAEFLSIIQPIMICMSDGNFIQEPTATGGDELCENSSGTDLPAYGIWPTVGASGTHTVLGNYSADSNFDDGTWYFANEVNSSGSYICCNSTYNRCKVMNLANGGACSSAILN